MHLVLDLADKYPHNSLAAHIFDFVVQFLPALLCPCTRRGRVSHIVSNAKRFQRGDWKGFWEAALREERRETDNNVKGKRNRVKRDTSSIQARVVYSEHCARKGSLSKSNQAITSTSIPNTDPTNIDFLRTKHPKPVHPSRYLIPTRMPNTQNLPILVDPTPRTCPSKHPEPAHPCRFRVGLR
jgi:hypothetical protein